MKPRKNPQLIAAVEQMQDNGRYQADGCTHKLIYKLYSDGKVVCCILKETNEGTKYATKDKRAHNLKELLVSATNLEEFADWWARLYRGQDFDRMNKFMLEQLEGLEDGQALQVRESAPSGRTLLPELSPEKRISLPATEETKIQIHEK